MTVSRYASVDTSGHTLRGDVAAAYLRAIKGGMPKGGVDVFQRSWNEQAQLRDNYLHHGGPLAAKPSWTAPHIDQRAFDMHTTTAGKYAPSAAHAWACKGGVGSSKPKAGEKLRINEYGFYRSVPSERWHFEYKASLDKHRAADLTARLKALGMTLRQFQKSVGLDDDGIDGPLTWSALLAAKVPVVIPPVVVVPPVVTPTGPQPVDFRFGTYNAQLQRFGGGSDAADAMFVDDVLGVSVLAGQEVDEDQRDEIRATTDMLVYPFNTVAIFWYPGKYEHGDRIEVDLGTDYHGMIGTELTSKKNGNTFVAASVHIRPNDAIGGTDAHKALGKKNDIDKVIAKLAKYPRVAVGGDWSTATARAQMEKAGYKLVTPYVDTYDKPGVQHLDFVFVRGLSDRTGGSEHETKASDHDGMLANLTLPVK